MLILIFFLYLGQVTFSYVFRVELYSFQITCGAVLMYNGLSGLLKGFFMKVDEHIKIADLTTVPIAIPMIAVIVDLIEIYRNSVGEKRSCKDVTINTFCIGFTKARMATKQLNIKLNFITSPY